MTPKLNMQNTNPVAVAAFLGFTFAGAIGTAVTQRPYPLIAGVASGRKRSSCASGGMSACWDREFFLSFR